MILHIPSILNQEMLHLFRSRLEEAQDQWISGRTTAGHQGVRIKDNLQIKSQAPFIQELSDLLFPLLQNNPHFFRAVLPYRYSIPLFNRYEEGMHYGLHIDASVRQTYPTGEPLRTDLSATLFLTPPEHYDGGELVIEDTYGSHTIKPPAGDIIVYPSTSLHEVKPISRGQRLACVLWIQSMIRDDAERALLYSLDTALQTLIQSQAEENACMQLAGCYHNLIRKWSTV